MTVATMDPVWKNGHLYRPGPLVDWPKCGCNSGCSRCMEYRAKKRAERLNARGRDETKWERTLRSWGEHIEKAQEAKREMHEHLSVVRVALRDMVCPPLRQQWLRECEQDRRPWKSDDTTRGGGLPIWNDDHDAQGFWSLVVRASEDGSIE